MDGNGETTIFHVKIWNHPIETTILIRGCFSSRVCFWIFLKLHVIYCKVGLHHLYPKSSRKKCFTCFSPVADGLSTKVAKRNLPVGASIPIEFALLSIDHCIKKCSSIDSNTYIAKFIPWILDLFFGGDDFLVRIKDHGSHHH